MRLRRRLVPFSAVAVLERLWLVKKGVKTPVLILNWSGLSDSVLFRSLTALRESGLVRAYWSPVRMRVGRKPRFWSITERGLELLKVLLPYRDWWEVLDNRDLRPLAQGIKLLDRLERERHIFFPDGVPIDARTNYLRRQNRYVRHPLIKNVVDSGQGL